MNVRIIVTGNSFLGGSFRSINAVIEELITGSLREVIILTYIITGSSRRLLRLLEDALDRGVTVKLVIDHIQEEDYVLENWIKEMQSKHNSFTLIVVNEADMNLHAKVIISDRCKAIIGSANFTWPGLTKNYEIGVYLEGPEVWNLSTLIDKTFLLKNKSLRIN